MKAGYERERVLITVMTYPHPSDKYQELVCTAGITAKGEWVRLYPIDYRYRTEEQKFKKYQWIDVGLSQRGKGNDNRKESRQPDLDSITLGETLSTKNNWETRRRIIDALPHFTRNQLREAYNKDRTSLGIVRPYEILDIEVKKLDESAWKPKQQNILNQMKLFGSQPKQLRKIPYSFHYIFRCEDSDKRHKAIIEDLGIGSTFS